MPYRVVICSRNEDNLTACVKAILRNQPDLTPDRIIVVNDGLSIGDLMREFGGVFPFTIVQGEKPFVYARNNNIGIRHAGTDDCLLTNDDALLTTPNGFNLLAEACAAHPEIGILSPAINNVGNTNQNQAKGSTGIRYDDRMLCFSCVYIPRKTFDAVGLLEECYVAYGMEDDSYSLMVRNAGLKLGILDSVFVDHGSLKSEYRGKGSGDYRPNLRIFIRKWGHDNWGKTKENSQFPECFED